MHTDQQDNYIQNHTHSNSHSNLHSHSHSHSNFVNDMLEHEDTHTHGHSHFDKEEEEEEVQVEEDNHIENGVKIPISTNNEKSSSNNDLSFFERPQSPFWDQPPSITDNNFGMGSLNSPGSNNNSGNNLFKMPGTPPNNNFMDSIHEHELEAEDSDNTMFFQPPPTSHRSKRASWMNYGSPPQQQPPSMGSSFYKLGNNSSGNLIANAGFKFGGNISTSENNNNNIHSTTSTSTTTTTFNGIEHGNENSSLEFLQPPTPLLEPTGTGGSNHSGYGGSGSRRNSRYMPGPKFPPPSRINKSPTRRNQSPERKSISIPGSPTVISRDGKQATVDSPFNFQSLSSHNNNGSNFADSSSNPGQMNGLSRTAFRKGHRYKHSSVSMNFFQEPEVKIPLNIAKALPIPDINDLKTNMIWPQTHLKLLFTGIELIVWLFSFQVGQIYHLNNFITLSHFVFFDVLGASVLILVEILQQFEVWNQGTITFPFGLNRLELILSFAQAISLCYMGLDLVFHIVEEGIVQFIEATSSHNEVDHHDIDMKIPHSHETNVTKEHLKIWYITLIMCFVVSLTNYYYTYQNKKLNRFNKFKISNPIVTIAYIGYLICYPLFPSQYLDYAATILISIFIFRYGAEVAKYASNILLLGFPSQEFSVDTFKLMDQITNDIKELPEYSSKACDFKSCKIFKVNFDTYVVLIRIQLIGGSSEREHLLRKSIDAYLRSKLCINQIQNSEDSEDSNEINNNKYILESTIEIDLV